MHGRDRATKHEHQAKGEKDFADDFCFHISYPSMCFVSMLRPSIELAMGYCEK